MIQSLEHFNIVKIAESGQCFRIRCTQDGLWLAAANGRVLRIRVLSEDQNGGSTCDFDCDGREFQEFWKDYFDLDTDYAALCRLADPADPYLQAAIEYGRVIRILKQNLWETTISFIISQRKNIPAIRRCVEMLCDAYGPETENGIHAFPSPEALAGASPEDLKKCSLGYRASYVYMSARMILEAGLAGDELWAPEIGGGIFPAEKKEISPQSASEKLLSLPGVGAKISSCILLFALHDMAAFPRDTWMLRIEKKYYGGRFPEEKYPSCAGLMQQYMFFYEKRKP